MNADPDSKAKAKVVPLKGSKCPMCGKRATLEMRPFCSKRCKNIDLQRWLGGHYRMVTEEEPDPGEPIPIDPENS